MTRIANSDLLPYLTLWMQERRAHNSTEKKNQSNMKTQMTNRSSTSWCRLRIRIPWMFFHVNLSMHVKRFGTFRSFQQFRYIICPDARVYFYAWKKLVVCFCEMRLQQGAHLNSSERMLDCQQQSQNSQIEVACSTKEGSCQISHRHVHRSTSFFGVKFRRRRYARHYLATSATYGNICQIT